MVKYFRKKSYSIYDNKFHLAWIVKYRKKILVGDKGKSSRKLQQEFPSLRKDFWGRHLWAIGYYSATSGNITDEMIMKYIEEQGENPDDDEFFRIQP